MAHAVFEQPARQRQHLGGRRELRAQYDASDKARAFSEPGETKPPERRCFEETPRPIPEAEGPAAEAVGEGNLEQVAVRGGLSDVAVRRQMIRLEWRAHEGRAVVNPFPIDERAD